jgi:hypothetical protein
LAGIKASYSENGRFADGGWRKSPNLAGNNGWKKPELGWKKPVLGWKKPVLGWKKPILGW